MRGIIDYSGKKSFVSFITHVGNGSIVAVMLSLYASSEGDGAWFYTEAILDVQ